VHARDIIYRDLKPENVLLDQHGNVRLTDFGLSKEGVSDHSTGATSFCGTPEYIAPEVLLRQGHGRAVDWWSLGALLYEMITGLPPFYSRNRETMFEKIMKAELSFPPFMTENAKNLLGRLLVRDPKERLGSGERDAQVPPRRPVVTTPHGVHPLTHPPTHTHTHTHTHTRTRTRPTVCMQELKEHPFFVDVDWDGLSAGRVTPPWTPTVVGSLDTSQVRPHPAPAPTCTNRLHAP